MRMCYQQIQQADSLLKASLYIQFILRYAEHIFSIQQRDKSADKNQLCTLYTYMFKMLT